MPPGKSKRPKIAESSSGATHQLSKPVRSVTLAVDTSNTENKFTNLPTELLREIISYIPAVQIPTGRHFHTPVLPPCALDHWDTLRTLSQTCRSWRSIFFPMLWERMEVCALRTETPLQYRHAPDSMESDLIDYRGEDIPANWYREISCWLEQVSRGIISNSHAAACVRVVNVTLTRFSPDTVLPAFVECLENLPNLHTVQILHAHSQMTTMLKTHFKGHRFPTVQAIILPDHAHEVLRCCPEVRTVVCNDDDGSKLISAIAKECKKVEILEGFSPKNRAMKRLVKACPKLREIKLRHAAVDDFRQLASLKNLKRIEFRVHEDLPDTYHKDPKIAERLKVARDILKESSTKERKILRVWYEDSAWDRPFYRWTREFPLNFS